MIVVELALAAVLIVFLYFLLYSHFVDAVGRWLAEGMTFNR
jgi:hypothetical protein